MNQKNSELLRVILAGALVLLVVHTLGRFIYTPLLPWLVEDGLLSLKQVQMLQAGIISVI